MDTSHDARYKRLFSHPRAIRDLLTGFAPGPWLEEADFTTLERVNGSYITDTDKQRHDDMVWRVKVAGHWFWIYVVLEFQSRPDRWMALRMMVYVGLLGQHLVREHRKDLSRGRLPPILPIVLYTGEPAWHAPLNVADCFIQPPESLQPYLPCFQYHLIDEQRLKLHPLAEVRNVTAAVFALENSRSDDDILTLLYALGALLAAPDMQSLREDLEKWAKTSLRGHVPASTIDQIHSILEGEGMLAERFEVVFKQVEQRGRQAGLLAGLLEGEQKGMLAGEQKGLLEGEAKVLARLLKRRFGPLPDWASARLRAADAAQLEMWADVVLDATSLDEVLGATEGD
ncbi:transposase [Betaproteobacteria bacterium]|nr:transposase [Betaproteobacteria bacterium]GHU19800.1 transposase [Betaproteobacteria bacterium]